MLGNRTDLLVSVVVAGLPELATLHGPESARLAATFMQRAIDQELGPFDRSTVSSDGQFAIDLVNATAEEAEELLERIRMRFDNQMFDAGFEIEVDLVLDPGAEHDGTMFTHSLVSDFPMYLN